MASEVAKHEGPASRAWHIVGRWQEYEGEARANLLRIVGIAAFYAIELANYHGLNLGFLQLPQQAGVTPEFHRAVTALAVAWTMVALAVHLCLVRQVFPAALKYISTAADLLLLTSVLMVADGPQSPLVVGYFLIITLSALRFSLPLVRFATVGALAGYLVVCGHARWFAVRDVRVPRYQQIMVLLALTLTGIVLGQILRRVPTMAMDFANRTRQSRGA
ncbi:MAG: hypothetical protein ACT4QC_22730 [Planctomycetaceae bacterium]